MIKLNHIEYGDGWGLYLGRNISLSYNPGRDEISGFTFCAWRLVVSSKPYYVRNVLGLLHVSWE